MIEIHHLETDITQACQLSCVGCNHSVPLWRVRAGGPWMADPEQVASDLSHFTRVAHANIWGALGGEPLLNPRLIEILQVVRGSGVADEMEVWTNGIVVPKMSEEFWKWFDVLVLSVYPGKLTDEQIDWIREKCKDTGRRLVVKDERFQPNFRTMLESVPTDTAVTEDKFKRCFFRQFSRVLNYGFFFTCCCAPHLPMLMQGQSFGTDGIAIENITEEALSNYLTREEPLGACTICAGRGTAKPLTWHEIKNPARWIAASKGIENETVC